MYFDYDFEKYFDVEQHVDMTDEFPTTFNGYINYLKTYSAYNSYLKKHPEKLIDGDPVEIHKQKCLE